IVGVRKENQQKLKEIDTLFEAMYKENDLNVDDELAEIEKEVHEETHPIDNNSEKNKEVIESLPKVETHPVESLSTEKPKELVGVE
ncbi:hypothetical protein EIN_213100, partial [Entamoeba invadens IP1]